MKLEGMNWMQVEEYLKQDDRIVVPIGSTEQHGYLSLLTDTLVVERVSEEACEKEAVIMAPVIPFGFTHFYLEYPGVISLSAVTLNLVMRDVLASLIRGGFKRILVVSGHAQNDAVMMGALCEAMDGHPDVTIGHCDPWEDAWPMVKEETKVYDSGHAAFQEAFPFCRVAEIPDKKKTADELCLLFKPPLLNPHVARRLVGDGVTRGPYRWDDEELYTRAFEMMVETVRRYLREL